MGLLEKGAKDGKIGKEEMHEGVLSQIFLSKMKEGLNQRLLSLSNVVVDALQNLRALAERELSPPTTLPLATSTLPTAPTLQIASGAVLVVIKEISNAV